MTVLLAALRFLIDESADARVAAYLRSFGCDATTVAGDHQAGVDDETVLAIARRERRILITDDPDFGELVVRHGVAHAGVIFFRLGTTVLAKRIARLEHVLTHHRDDLQQGRYLIVTKGRVRVHTSGGERDR